MILKILNLQQFFGFVLLQVKNTKFLRCSWASDSNNSERIIDAYQLFKSHLKHEKANLNQ